MEKDLIASEFFKKRDEQIREEFEEWYDPEIHKRSGIYKRIAEKYDISPSRVEQIIKG